jgi:hypothetical protein
VGQSVRVRRPQGLARSAYVLISHIASVQKGDLSGVTFLNVWN